MLEVYFGVTADVGRLQLVVVFDDVVADTAARFAGLVAHHVDAFIGIVVPCRENENMAAIDQLLLTISRLGQFFTYVLVGDYEDFELLQAAGGGRKAQGFKDRIDFVVRDNLVGVHFLVA